jgi:hypothetical protein
LDSVSVKQAINPSLTVLLDSHFFLSMVSRSWAAFTTIPLYRMATHFTPEQGIQPHG